MPWLQKRPENDKDVFYETGIAAVAVTEGCMVKAQVGDRVAIITRVGDQLIAFSNVCPHAAADLTKGRLTRQQIKCPEHGYTFDLRSGRATWPPGEGCRLIRYTAVEKNGFVNVRLSTPGAKT